MTEDNVEDELVAEMEPVIGDVDLQTADLFVTCLSRHRANYQGESPSEMARGIIDDLIRQHLELIDFIETFTNEAFNDQIPNPIARLNRHIKDIAENITARAENATKERVFVVSDYSVIDRASVKTLEAGLHPLMGVGMESPTARPETAYNFIAAYILFNARLFARRSLDFTEIENYQLDMAFARIALATQAQRGHKFLDPGLKGSNERLSKLERRLEDIEKKRESLGDKWSDIDKRAEGVSTQITEIESKVGKASDTMSGFEDKIENLKHTALESINLQNAGDLWEKRVKNYRWDMRFSVVLLCFAFALPISIAVFFHAEILNYLKDFDVPSGTDNLGQVFSGTVSTIGRIALVGAPLGFYVWLTRIIVRYHTRSMLLHDDAQQRVTTMKTYLNLLAESGAHIKDRAVVLEALFRRAPGHGPDTIEPPDFTELLKVMSDQKKKP